MRACVLAVVLLANASVYAQPANWRTMTKAQLEALPKEQLAQLPFFDVNERTDAKLGRAKMETVVAMSLHRLFFAMDKPLAPYGAYLGAAVREFQGDIGAKADGTLTLGQFQTIMDRVQALDRAAFPIFPPFKRNLFVTDKYASFGGTWIIENEQHAFPVNHTLYKCYRDEILCYTSEAYLISTGGSGTLSVDSTTLKILK